MAERSLGGRLIGLWKPLAGFLVLVIVVNVVVEEEPNLCSMRTGKEEWEIWNMDDETYVGVGSSDPELPSCPFGG